MNSMRDTMIAAHLIRSGIQKSGFSLDALLDDYGIYKMDKSERNSFIGRDKTLPYTEAEKKYAAIDILYMHKLHSILMSEIRELGLTKVYNLECAAIPVTGDMELNGIPINTKKWLALESVTRSDRLKSRKELDVFFKPFCDVDLFGDPIINYSSPQQVKPILEKLEGTSLPGTGKDVLKELNHPVGKAMLKYREADKRVTAFGENFLRDYLDVDNRIHSNFHQTGTTDSGRYSSSNPNMQQIPRDARYRAAFEARNGWKMVGADYSSVELVLLAEFSGDEEFMKIFINDVDAHCRFNQ